MSVVSYGEIYEKLFHVQLNNLQITAMAFNLFLERKPMEQLQHIIPAARGASFDTVIVAMDVGTGARGRSLFNDSG